MVSVSLGPIALPVAPLLLLAALWAATWTATRLWRRETGNTTRAEGADPAGQTVVVAAAIGLLVARLVHLASNAAPYLASPMSMLDLRDGGWHAGNGAAAGAAWLAWRGWRMPACRRTMAIASLTGAAVWVAGALLTGQHSAAPMPATALARLEGGQAMTLAGAAAGRPAVVNLWASWCGPCRQEMPTLAAAQQRETEITFLFVNQGESETTIRGYLASQALPLREVLLDRTSQLGPAVGSRGLPTTLFYDAAGSLVDAHFGVLNAAALESRLQALRARR